MRLLAAFVKIVLTTLIATLRRSRGAPLIRGTFYGMPPFGSASDQIALSLIASRWAAKCIIAVAASKISNARRTLLCMPD